MLWAFHAALIALLAAVLLELCLNLRALRRLSKFGLPSETGAKPAVSVVIPARNEAVHIASCLPGWLGQTAQPAEILVLDDESTDDTPARARQAAAHIPWVRVLRGARKPPGWSGKSFACHQLATMARGDLLVFADADVVVAPGALAALKAVFAETEADAVTVLPRHTARSRIGRHSLPFQTWVLACFHPLWLAARRPAALLATANGQLLAFRRAAYEAVGGHQAVWQSLAEDADLGRRLVAAGFRLVLVDGTDLVTCHVHETLRQIWLANTKNLHAVLFHSLPLALAVMAGLVLGWVVPWLGLAAEIARGGTGFLLPALETALGLASRIIVACRFRYPLRDAWSHPLLVLLLASMIGTSAWVHRWGRVSWREREYTPRAALRSRPGFRGATGTFPPRREAASATRMRV